MIDVFRIITVERQDMTKMVYTFTEGEDLTKKTEHTIRFFLRRKHISCVLDVLKIKFRVLGKAFTLEKSKIQSSEGVGANKTMSSAYNNIITQSTHKKAARITTCSETFKPYKELI